MPEMTQAHEDRMRPGRIAMDGRFPHEVTEKTPCSSEVADLWYYQR